MISSVTGFYAVKNNTNVSAFNWRTKYFMNSFFANVINEWKKLGIKIKHHMIPLKNFKFYSTTTF